MTTPTNPQEQPVTDSTAPTKRPGFFKRPHPKLLPVLVIATPVLLIAALAGGGGGTPKASAPSPAPTVTVTRTVQADDSDQVAALRVQLASCEAAWTEIAKRENTALQNYAEATQSIVQAVQNGDATGLTDATESIKTAGDEVEAATPLVSSAHSTCTDS